ncbi:MAG: outer membrane beta-barrel protein, partial [Tannerella sp.]|nr:outer membrane beta-barrel protein [Tannerella sp.]
MKKIYTLLLLVLFVFDGNICAQNPVCVNIYNEGLALMNKKDKGSYQEAVKKFEAAGICDEKLLDDCKKKISECKKAIESLSTPPKSADKPSSTSTSPATTKPSPATTPATVRVSKNKIRFPEQGGVENISVSGNNNWTLSDDVTWCVAERGGNSIVITCEPNKTTRSRTAIIEVKGSNNKITVTVEQVAAKEQLSVLPEALTLPAEGTEDMITVYSNTSWNVTTALSWCRVEKEDNTIKVKADANDSTKERKGDITVKSETLTRTISVSQGAGREEKKVVQPVPEPNDDKKNVETKTGTSSARDVSSGRNVPSNRRSSVRDASARRNVSSGRDVSSDRDESSRRGAYSEGNTPSGGGRASSERESSSGRKISFGIMANALMPNFSVKASGFTESAIDYGHGKNIEKPSYSSKTGFSGGLVADIRILKNVYVQTGLYYTNLGIKNVISGDYAYSQENYTSATYLEGTGHDNFTEDYTLNYLEIPVLLSYRISLAKKTNLQINAGPYIG